MKHVIEIGNIPISFYAIMEVRFPNFLSCENNICICNVIFLIQILYGANVVIKVSGVEKSAPTRKAKKHVIQTGSKKNGFMIKIGTSCIPYLL
jgi:hypothetical protein